MIHLTLKFDQGDDIIIPNQHCVGSVNSDIRSNHKGLLGCVLDLEGTGHASMDDSFKHTCQTMFEETGFRDVVENLGGHIKKRRSGLYKEIHFGSELPYWIMVAALGFFRQYDNSQSAPATYMKFRNLGVSPMVAYLGAITPEGGLTNPRLFETYDVVLTTRDEHMVVPYYALNKKYVSAIKNWQDRVPDLVSMADEFDETNQLTYYGRNGWFIGDLGIYSDESRSVVKTPVINASYVTKKRPNSYERAKIDVHQFITDILTFDKES